MVVFKLPKLKNTNMAAVVTDVEINVCAFQCEVLKFWILTDVDNCATCMTVNC
jgi:hypothetical protein